MATQHFETWLATWLAELSVSTVLGLQNKVPQSRWLKTKMYYISQFWRLTVPNQGVDEVGSSEDQEENLFHASFLVSDSSQAISGHPWLAETTHQDPSCPNVLPVSVCMSKFPLFTWTVVKLD